jgi:hypothetical protein
LDNQEKYMWKDDDILREKIKWNHIKCSIKTRKGRKGNFQQQIKTVTNMVDIVMYINNHFKYKWCLLPIKRDTVRVDL